MSAWGKSGLSQDHHPVRLGTEHTPLPRPSNICPHKRSGFPPLNVPINNAMSIHLVSRRASPKTRKQVEKES